MFLGVFRPVDTADTVWILEEEVCEGLTAAGKKDQSANALIVAEGRR